MRAIQIILHLTKVMRTSLLIPYNSNIYIKMFNPILNRKLLSLQQFWNLTSLVYLGFTSPPPPNRWRNQNDRIGDISFQWKRRRIKIGKKFNKCPLLNLTCHQANKEEVRKPRLRMIETEVEKNKTGTDRLQDCCKNWSITQD